MVQIPVAHLPCQRKDAVSLKDTACQLPADPSSVHADARQASLALFNEIIGNVGKQTVASVLAMLGDVSFEQAGTGTTIPTPMVKLCLFVKGESLVKAQPGKICSGGHLAKFLPFTERAFLTYVADLVAALRIWSTIDSQSTVAPFELELAFLTFVDSVADANNCPITDVVSATQDLRLLSIKSSLEVLEVLKS